MKALAKLLIFLPLLLSLDAARCDEAAPQLVVQRGITPQRGDNPLLVSPDGTRFICGSGVFDAASGERLWNLNADDAYLSFAAWSSDGRLVAGGGLAFKFGVPQGMIALWSADDGHLLRSWRSGQAFVQALAFSPDGTTLLTASAKDIAQEEERGEMCLWNVADGRLIKKLGGCVASRAVVAWSPDGTQCAATAGCDYDGFHGVWDKYGSSVKGVLPGWVKDSVVGQNEGLSKPSPLAHSADGKFVLERKDRTLTLLRTGETAPLAQMTASETYSSAGTTSGGKWLLTESRVEKDKDKPFLGLPIILRGWRLDEAAATWREAWQITTLPELPIALAATKNVVATSSVNNIAAIWDLKSGAVRAVPSQKFSWCVALSPDGKFFAASHLWDMSSDVPRKIRELSAMEVLRFSRDCRLLLQSGGFWDMRNGKFTELREQEPYGDDLLEHIFDAAFSGDGKYLATLEETSHKVLIWDVRTARVV